MTKKNTTKMIGMVLIIVAVGAGAIYFLLPSGGVESAWVKCTTSLRNYVVTGFNWDIQQTTCMVKRECTGIEATFNGAKTQPDPGSHGSLLYQRPEGEVDQGITFPLIPLSDLTYQTEFCTATLTGDMEYVTYGEGLKRTVQWSAS